MSPRVTVVIPHFNTPPGWIAQAVRSILEQELDDLEVFFVDDSSPDGAWIEALRPLRERRLQVFRTSHNVGPYRIKNRILELTRSPWFALQDADDWSHPARLRRQIDAAERWRTQVVGCSFSYIDPDGKVVRPKRMVRHVNLWVRLRKAFVLLHPTTMISTQLLRDLGGFDGQAFVGADDDFLLRAVHVARIRNLPDDLYAYRTHDSALTSTSSTGWGSSLRANYIRDLMERDRRRWWGPRWISRAALDDLQARPVDLDFELEPIEL
ncbi:MAG: glycosyltransferase family 2 protein [Acidobacteriota bacterium]